MDTTPLLSIIVPVYKAEKYLSDCIDSIVSQTFLDYELILINDGSPDKCGMICDSYAAKNKNIKVIHKKNEGASSARNIGLESARGKYIGWVDADDRIARNMYEILCSLAEYFQADITECQHLTLNGNQIIRSGVDEPVVHGSDDFILKQFFSARMKPSLWNKIYKRELWDGIRFPTARIHQDCYVNIRFALMPLVYVRTSDPLYYYIIRSNSITTTLTSREIRQAIYLYDYTMRLSDTIAKTNKVREYLTKDAINRLMCRYFEISVNSRIKNLHVYNYYIRKKIGPALTKYLLMAKLPIKTRISYILVLLNHKNLQIFLHNIFGKRDDLKLLANDGVLVS